MARKLNLRAAYFIPHSFLFVILLTFLVYFLGILVAYQGPFEMVQFWVQGVWNLLSFSMQMVLLVAAGFSVASAPFSQRVLRFLASLPSSSRKGVVFLAVFTALCSLLHWGLGIIAGAFLAREMGRRVPGIDYPLLVASAFIGMACGNLGLFASDPLVIRKAAPILEKAMGSAALPQIPWSPANLLGSILGLAGVTALLGLISPEEKEATPPRPDLLERFVREDRAEQVTLAAEREVRRNGKLPFGVWLEHSRWPVWLISVMGFSYIVFWFYGQGFALNLNTLIFVLFTLALCLHDTPMHFLQSLENSARAAHGIIVQFPFYAGTQGMLASSGLAALATAWVLSAAGPATYPTLVYFHAAVLNLFAPTSGGAWEVQGPLVGKAAQTLELHLPRVIQAFSAGEMMGNVIHPFWTIPLMGICGLSVRDILGYCLMAFVILSAIWILCLNFLPV
ncbi:MAG: short-chain fatty acid transporter [Syntrophaceae bacterium]|nr:short-chain fatty acid transporter [Syntrophaceae bacterium]